MENTVSCLDLTNGKEFDLHFNDLRKQRAFINKCRYSSRIYITSFTYQSEEERLYLKYGK